MKKVLFFAVAICAIGFTSCKKDWTCTCTDEFGDSYSYEIQNSRRPEASTACNAFEFAGENCSLN